jgi:hypothetical protein
MSAYELEQYENNDEDDKWVDIVEGLMALYREGEFRR